MALYPLDAVRNAWPDRRFDPLLARVREAVARSAWPEELGGVDDVLEAFDIAEARMNVALGLLGDVQGTRGADVGAGLGFLSVALREAGANVTATERAGVAIPLAQAEGIRVVTWTLGLDPRAPLPSGSLDWVVFTEVLEHLKEPPVRAIGAVAEVLRPGGRLVLSTPNIARRAHLEALIAGETFLEPFSEDIPPGDDPTDHLDHVREYSLREVVEAVEAAGLEIERVVMTGWGAAGYDLLPNPYANEIIALSAAR